MFRWSFRPLQTQLPLPEKIRAITFDVWKPLSISLANQAVSSGSNFLLAIFFVRYLSTGEFGIYGVGFAAVLLFSGVGNALLLTQLVVHLPDKKSEEMAAYLGRNFVLVSGLSLLCVVVAALSALVFSVMAGQDHAGIMMLATGFAAGGYLGRDFFVRISYSLRRESEALLINTTSASAIVALVLAKIGSGYPLGAASAIAIYAIGQWTGLVAGLVVSWSQFRIRGAGSVLETLRESVQGGKWALGGMLVTWLQSQAYIYMTAMVVGPVGVGYVNAARIFVSPFFMAVPAINQVTLPRLASRRLDGAAKVVALGRGVTVFVLVCATVYLGLLAVGYPVVADLVLDGKYEGVEPLVAAWCAVLLMQIARDGASTLLQTMRKFRKLTTTGAVLACLSVPLTAVMTQTLGAGGAVLATALAELGLAIALWGWIQRHAR